MYKPLLKGLLSIRLLAGFTGKEKYVQLEGYVNGRSSAAFTGQDRNVLKVLKAGTFGEIIEYKRLPSGNYGLRIRVMSGPYKSRFFWVYHKVSNSDLALFEKVPQDVEGTNTRRVSSVEDAGGIVTRRDTPARSAIGTPRVQAVDDTRRAIELVAHSNSAVRTAGQAPCVNCSLAPILGRSSLLRPPTTRAMLKACSDFVNPQGQLGVYGQSIFSIMAEPQYLRHFTSPNALGRFCPKFNSLSQSEKLHAWTWFWTALAKEESSCNATVIHKTTYYDKKSGKYRILNPREGYGLWALERDRNVRRWRGAACSNISTVANQARCSIDIMVERQLSKGRKADNTDSKWNYWGPIKRADTQIMPHMRRLSLCF